MTGVEAITDLAASRAAGRALPGRDAGEFSRVLAAAGRDRQAVREAATQLVSSTFIMPVLSSLREHSRAEPPFAPGFAERQFQPMLDQEIADRIASASGFPLVDIIVDRLLGPETPEPSGARSA